jgi:hypothetical protein
MDLPPPSWLCRLLIYCLVCIETKIVESLLRYLTHRPTCFLDSVFIIVYRNEDTTLAHCFNWFSGEKECNHVERLVLWIGNPRLSGSKSFWQAVPSFLCYCAVKLHTLVSFYVRLSSTSIKWLNTKHHNVAGPSVRAVWGVGLDHLDAETVGSNSA